MSKNIAVQSFNAGSIIQPSNAGSVQNFASVLQDMSNNVTARTFNYNTGEAAVARDWQKMMSDTSHQREVEDLKRAGLNPVLSVNSGANAYSASSASANADSSAIGALASIYQTEMNNDNARQIANMNNKNSLQIAKINAAASNYSANMASSASKYASDNSAAASRYGSDKSYSGTTAGMIDSLGFSPRGNKVAKGAHLGVQAFGNIISNILRKKL